MKQNCQLLFMMQSLTGSYFRWNEESVVATCVHCRAVSYFMSGLARSTALLNFRFVPGGARGITIHRPQGYLSKRRDAVMMSGKLVEEVTEGVPTRDSVTVIALGGVKVELRGEIVHARAAESDNETNIVELIWD